MKQMDILFISNAKTEALYQITKSAIDSLLKSETEIKFNIIVIEQTEREYEYATTLQVSGKFNYNKFLNLGIGYCKSEYIALCNNDLVFQSGWANAIIKAMKEHSLLSASPMCPVSHKTQRNLQPLNYGYEIYYRLCGWCIVVNKQIFKSIGKLDESFPFWYADNCYGNQIRKAGIEHAMIRDSKVIHLGSKTLKTLPPLTQRGLTHEETARYKLTH